jgi:hypothetical protein
VVATSIRSSSSSATEDTNAAKEDISEGLQFSVRLSSSSLFCPKLSDDLLQSIVQLDPIERRSKDQVTNPHNGFLKVQVPLLLLLKPSNQLIHNFHLEGFSGQAPEHKLRGGGHRSSENGKLLDHLGVVEGTNLHSLR